MKTLLKLFLIIFLPTACVSCNDDDEPSIDEAYYVKYEATVTSQSSGDVRYTVNSDIGKRIFTGGKTFTETFGPIQKGFIASITADAVNLNSATCTVSIYICRGSEPFVLKKTHTSLNNASITYTFDGF